MKQHRIALLAALFLLLTASVGLAAAPMDHSAMSHSQDSQYTDQGFLSGMIGHHQDAVDMSTAILTTTKDKKIKTWAKGIIAAQKKEIALMEALLKPLGGLEQSVYDAMRHMDMSVYGNRDADSAFVAAMFDHHKSALTMTLSALSFSQDKRVIALAKSIIADQAKEMAEFRIWQLTSR